MAKIEAFLALEASVAAAMTVSWEAVSRKLSRSIGKAVRAGDFDRAYREANAITLTNIVERQRNAIEELLVSAMLFGASRLVAPRKSALATGVLSLPQALGGALDQLTVMVEEDGADHVRRATLQLIAQFEEEYRARGQEIQKADMDLADMLNAAVLGTGKGLIDVGANLTTSRLVSYGFLAQAIEMQIETYQVSEVLDSRTCPVCEYMHGKTFRVVHEHARLDQVLQIMDPKELRSAAPWPKQTKEGIARLYAMDAGELQAAGYGSPPYHPMCRGVLDKTGTVVERIVVRDQQPPANVLDPDAEDLVGNDMVPAKRHTSKHHELADYVSDGDVPALRYYTGAGYRPINRILRGIEEDLSDERLERAVRSIEDLKKQFRPTSMEYTTYRGVSLRLDEFRAFDVGDEITMAGFTSTSRRSGVSLGFLTPGHDNVGVMFQIKVPKGTKAIVTNPDESELILDHGTKLRVLKVHANPKMEKVDYVIEAEVIN